jgi:hypothetical protein
MRGIQQAVQATAAATATPAPVVATLRHLLLNFIGSSTLVIEILLAYTIRPKVTSGASAI